MKGLYWVRNDLRLQDNLSLNAFLEECQEGLIVWCPTKSNSRAGMHRQEFLEDSLFHFNSSLKLLGQHLHIAENNAAVEFEKIVRQFSIEKIYFSSLSSQEEKSEEEKVIKICLSYNIDYFSSDQETLINERDLPFELENMPYIFSDFRKKVELNLKIHAPLSLTIKRNLPLQQFNYVSKFKVHPGLIFHGGEDAALRRVHYYFGESMAIHTYKETRNGMLNSNDSSRLSPWLSLGILSPKTIIHELRLFESDHGANESTYWLLFELLWRDYLKFFSRKFKKQIFLEDGIKRGKHYISEKNQQLFSQWSLGKTPEVFINANMNELNHTGWMSNRGRQNVASYFVHQLKLPWIWGAAYFETQLIDYDCDLNWGNWLYLSGNGSDPRSRIFNIKRQAEVYDKESLYQKKWAP